MPKERERSHQDNSDQESRLHRSLHRHRSHCGDGRHRVHRHRDTPYHREKEPRSSTHIYFNGSHNVPSVSPHTDHVALASSLSTLMVQNGGMIQIFDNCYKMLERLRSNQIAHPGSLQQGTASSSNNGQREVNHSNLSNVPSSQKSTQKEHKPR